jgi:hypothetical protein
VKIIDAFLISGFERFSHWTQRIAGITCVRWSGYIMGPAVVGSMLAALLVKDWWYFFQAGVYLFMGFVYTCDIDTREGEAFHRVISGLKNPQKLIGCGIRVANMACSGVGWLIVSLEIVFPSKSPPSPLAKFIFVAIATTGYVMSRYFDACDPLPPGTSKVREWLNSLKRSLRLAPDSAGA